MVMAAHGLGAIARLHISAIRSSIVPVFAAAISLAQVKRIFEEHFLGLDIQM